MVGYDVEGIGFAIPIERALRVLNLQVENPVNE